MRKYFIAKPRQDVCTTKGEQKPVVLIEHKTIDFKSLKLKETIQHKKKIHELIDEPHPQTIRFCKSFYYRGYTYKRKSPKIGRNEPCPCESGLKYKKCCIDKKDSESS